MCVHGRVRHVRPPCVTTCVTAVRPRGHSTRVCTRHVRPMARAAPVYIRARPLMISLPVSQLYVLDFEHPHVEHSTIEGQERVLTLAPPPLPTRSESAAAAIAAGLARLAVDGTVNSLAPPAPSVLRRLLKGEGGCSRMAGPSPTGRPPWCTGWRRRCTEPTGPHTR